MGEEPIRGAATERQEKALGIVRQLFDPEWLQAFDSGRINVSFVEEPDFEAALESVLAGEGYERWEKDAEAGWADYVFEG